MLGLANYVMNQLCNEVPRMVEREQEPKLLGNLVPQPVLARVNLPPPLMAPKSLVTPFTKAKARAAQRAWER